MRWPRAALLAKPWGVTPRSAPAQVLAMTVLDGAELKIVVPRRLEALGNCVRLKPLATTHVFEPARLSALLEARLPSSSSVVAFNVKVLPA